ncbi:hypothetical protein [Trichlorobacter sp.]|uniref:hypothetical protein n=1 Tax=Trichlorobacter sp. TaxID=2911007 RepID=UPI002A35B23D|nr:hypothetical protein [Trichlorobacter sp.]MDY0384731.1 hypothetical protein [Trichlorobacter sp.]
MDKKGADLQRIEEKVGKDNSLVLRHQHQIHPKVCPDCGHNDYIFEENDSLLGPVNDFV